MACGSECKQSDGDFLNKLRSLHRRIQILISELTRRALYEAFKNEVFIKECSQEQVEDYVLGNPVPGFDRKTSKSQERGKSTNLDPLNAEDKPSNFELWNFVFEMKASFAETLNSLDLFEDYLQRRSEETAKPLKLLFDRGKITSDEFFTAEQTDKLSDFLPEISNSVKKNVDYNVDLYLNSQTNTIFEEASKVAEDSSVQDIRINKLIESLESKDLVIESLEIENREIWAELGQNIFEQTAKECERRKSVLFQQIYRSPYDKPVTEDDRRGYSNGSRANGNGSPNGFPKAQSTNAFFNPPVNGSMASKEANEISGNTGISIFSTNSENQNPTMQNMSSGGEGIDTSGNVNRTSDAASTSRDESGEQSSTLLRGNRGNPNYGDASTAITYSPSPVNINQGASSYCDTQTFDNSSLQNSAVSQKPENSNGPQSSGIGGPNDHQNGHRFHVNANASTSNGSTNSFPKHQTSNEGTNPSTLNATARGEQSVQGAVSLVQRTNHQPGKEQTITSYNTNDSENQNPTMQNSCNITNCLESVSQSYENLSFSVQQDDSNGRECISLGNIPPTSVATTLYNNYKLLLLSLGQRLLSSEVVKLMEWVSHDFSIENAQNATDVFLQLDQKGIINASDLSQLRDFFESIVRIDLVYIIDAFLLGDYSRLLRQTSALKTRDANRAQNSQHGSTSRFSSLSVNTLSSPSFPQGSRTAGSNVAASGSSQMSRNRIPATSRKPENSNGSQNSIAHQNHQPALSSFLANTNNVNLVSRSPNENQSRAHEQRNEKPIASGFTKTSVVVADGPVTNERRTTASNSSTRTNPPVKNNGSSITIGSNGSKLSKFSREGAERSIVSFAHAPNPSRNQDLDLESNWLCSHYKRLCYVKFECCDNFWPCHRCHNNQSTCGRKKLKSRDTQMVKCVYCNKEQQFGQSCCDCGAKFASYFCGLCQHLTGNDDHPYHCQKCGICRIHGDRSFHCDVCGVCLDVQLRGNHKCREGSAHDECCICLEFLKTNNLHCDRSFHCDVCGVGLDVELRGNHKCREGSAHDECCIHLEDAFTGCQILPCSHKVHKECATQMIRSGITRCPICRESFAHKLERRPMPNSRKRSGK